MDVISRFTSKNLKENKRRTIVTIIAVLLSTALITAVIGMASTLYGSMIKFYINTEGSYHAVIKGVPISDIGLVKDNAHVERVGITEDLGYSELEDSGYAYKKYIRVTAFDDTALKDVAINLKEGRLPNNDKEIVIAEHALTRGGAQIKIGDTLQLKLGDRIWNGQPVEDEILYYISEDEAERIIKNWKEEGRSGADTLAAEKEHLDIRTEKVYTVVGIIERPPLAVEESFSPGFSGITKLSELGESSKAKVYVSFDSPKNAGEYADGNYNTLVNSDQGYKGSFETNELCRLYGGVGDDILLAIYFMAAVVVLIIIATSAFVIGNSFSISVSEKKIQYGMLASVGATKKQIKKTVLREGAFIGGIGIVLGLILGTVVVEILCVIITFLLGEALNMSISFYMPIWIFFAAAFFGGVTSYLSCIIPAHRAMKVSPIESIRGNGEIKLSRKKLKTSRLTRKLFGIGGVISSKNLKRNRRQYRTTVISLVLAIAVFISLSTFLNQAKKVIVLQFADFGYDLEVYYGEMEKEEIQGLYSEIDKLDGIDAGFHTSYMIAGVNVEKYGTDYGKDYIKNEWAGIKTADGHKELPLMIVEMEPEKFKAFAKECGVTGSDYSKVAILEDDTVKRDEDGANVVDRFYTIKEGDSLDVAVCLSDAEAENPEFDNYSVKISKVTDNRPVGYRKTYTDGGYLFVSEDYFKNCTAERRMSHMYIKTEKPDEVEDDITDIIRNNPDYGGSIVLNEAEDMENSRNLLMVIEIFLYGFITVISLIGVTNVFNTITTNMNLRSREFAMLRSIGMTKKEFDHMIRLESLMYGAKSLLLGVPIGLVLSRLIYASLKSAFDFGYSIPVIPIIISIAFVAIIVGFTMKFSIGKINKQNIIETIRKQTY